MDEFKSIACIDSFVYIGSIDSSMDDAMRECHEENQERLIYECARGGWEISKDRLPRIKYFLALYHSKVAGVYKVNAGPWKSRAELTEGDGFLLNDNEIFLPGYRNTEYQMSYALKDCETIAEAKAVLAKLRVSEADMKHPFRSEDTFKRWQRAYFFRAEYDMSDIEDDNVKDFLGKTLLFPTGNGVFRTKHRGEHYNFDDNGILKTYDENIGGA